MSDGALRISILGDASQFKDTLADLQKRLEDFKEDLKTATGLDIPRLNLEIFGAETSIKQITEFGKFAQGSLGFYQQLKKELEGQLLVTTNRSEQEDLNKRLVNTLSIIKEIKSAGIEKPIPIPIIIEPPPPGSIADIKRQISETVKEKEIAIGVNLTNANIKLRDLRNQLNAAEKQGIEIEAKPITPVLENSIQGIKNRIDELNRKKVLIDIDNEGEIAQINQELDGLTAKLARASSISFDKNGAITANAGKSRQALTSLALVAQDLPFGFIAIQNNLPAVISSFGALKVCADGTSGFMASLGTALAGPAGLFLAFSAVTGAITFAVQKYGSLGEAVDAFIGKQNYLNSELKKASETLQEYNEGLITNDELIRKQKASTGSNITKIIALGSVIIDTSKSLDERKAALKELQKIDDDYFGALSIEKTNYDQLLGAINAYNSSLSQSAISKGFQDRLSRSNKELEDQEILLEKLRKRIDEVKAAPIKITSAGTIDKTAIDNATSAYNAQKVVVDALRKDQANYEEQLQRSINTEIGIKAPILSAAEAYRKKQEELKKTASGTKKLAKAVKDLDIAELERQGRIAAFKLEEQAYKNRLKAVEDNIKAEEKLFDQIEKRFESDAADADKLTKKVAPNASIERTTEPLAEIQRQFQLAYTAINQTFFEPLQNLFETFLNTGKFTFKEFTKSVLKSITSIVSKLAATGVITGLMYLLDPSGMLASFGGSFGGGQGGGNGILSALGSIFGAQPRKPDFNGVRPSGGGRGGEKVEFQIRGTNLVGVLNRANGEINRIG